MDDPPRSEDFVPAGLASFGIEADETDLAVLGAIHQLLWPPILQLLSLDTGEHEPELDPDLSQAP